MDFSTNLKAFLSYLPIDKMNGAKKLVAVSAHIVAGDTKAPISISEVRKRWPKTILKIKYNPAYYYDAQREGWVEPMDPGTLRLSDDGLRLLNDLSDIKKPAATVDAFGLQIFNAGDTHSFDKFLRGFIAASTKRVYVADSWVDEKIFDTVLDSSPRTSDLKLIYGTKVGSFETKANRFAKQYTKFVSKRYKKLHDRFIIIDDTGFVVGPSLKDAATNSPALVVMLDEKDSSALLKFFNKLWLLSI